MLALEAAFRAPALAGTLLAELVSEHERGLGTWQNTAFVLADLFEAAGSAVEAMTEVVAGLRVEPEAMRTNLARTGGFVFAEAVAMKLSESLGRQAAAALVERICHRALDTGHPLRQALAEDPETREALSSAELDALFDPAAGLTGATAMLDAVLADWRAARDGE